jgi:DNA mismatch repair ATPase MutS
VIGVMRVVEAEPEVPGRFGEIQQSFISDDTSGMFSRLTRLFEWEAARHSPMLHAGLNALVAYDAHVAAAIDRWHAANGVRFPAALDLVADAQAMLALATLAYENPGWTMPLIHDGVAPMIAAAECGHPLIAGGARVPNPVALAGSGAVLIVSGSNMSGKTTYLRAVGLNILLALAGGPVCGAEMRVARCRVRTSVRIEDDLAAGMSLFYAEVARIRDVVGDAEVAGAPPVLFLLDEILHGTNAADRREATRLVLQRLIAAGAAGIITTHDPSVADGIPTGPGSGAVEQRHFTDAVTANGSAIDMTFDYAIRPGPATTTNALRILRLLGLDQDA